LTDERPLNQPQPVPVAQPLEHLFRHLLRRGEIGPLYFLIKRFRSAEPESPAQ